MILSIAFTFVYILLYENFSNLTILGKRLFTGREIVWTSAFEHIKNSFLIGNGTDVVLDTVGGGTTVSAHNMLLSLWYTLGLVPVGTTVFFFVNKLKGKEGAVVDKISQLAFIATLFVCFFESFYTDPNIQIFFLLFLINNIKSNEEENADDPEEDSLLLVRGEAAEQAGEEMP
jgi:O-antigen ligase